MQKDRQRNAGNPSLVVERGHTMDQPAFDIMITLIEAGYPARTARTLVQAWHISEESRERLIALAKRAAYDQLVEKGIISDDGKWLDS